jgi:hypothetical protein
MPDAGDASFFWFTAVLARVSVMRVAESFCAAHRRFRVGSLAKSQLVFSISRDLALFLFSRKSSVGRKYEILIGVRICGGVRKDGGACLDLKICSAWVCSFALFFLSRDLPVLRGRSFDGGG